VWHVWHTCWRLIAFGNGYPVVVVDDQQGVAVKNPQLLPHRIWFNDGSC
jgi:hypothetical protein